MVLYYIETLKFYWSCVFNFDAYWSTIENIKEANKEPKKRDKSGSMKITINRNVILKMRARIAANTHEKL